MNRFVQHVPSFVYTDEKPLTGEFESTKDLLSLDVVKRYGNSDDFSHFAIGDNCLMEISDDGFKWWVVGYIKNPDDVDLPQWDGGKYRAELPSGKMVTLGQEVVMSCGNVLTLSDGSKAINLKG